jgi:GlpG protein
LNWIVVKYFPIEQDLGALVQFLNERGVRHLITEEQGQQALAVVDPDIIPALNQFLDNYASGRVELHSAKTATPSSAEMDSQELIKNIQSTPVVFALILLSAIGTILANTQLGSVWRHYFTFLDFTERAYIPLLESLSRGEVWRLLTPAFLHGGMVHFVFNALGVWILGRHLEKYLGPWLLIVLVIIAAVISNVSQYVSSGPNFSGISGVIYAFVGFMAVIKKIRPGTFPEISKELLGFMLFWLVLCLTGVVDLFMAGGIGNASHVGGLFAGVIYALMTNIFRVKAKS